MSYIKGGGHLSWGGLNQDGQFDLYWDPAPASLGDIQTYRLRVTQGTAQVLWGWFVNQQNPFLTLDWADPDMYIVMEYWKNGNKAYEVRWTNKDLDAWEALKANVFGSGLYAIWNAVMTRDIFFATAIEGTIVDQVTETQPTSSHCYFLLKKVNGAGTTLVERRFPDAPDELFMEVVQQGPLPTDPVVSLPLDDGTTSTDPDVEDNDASTTGASDDVIGQVLQFLGVKSADVTTAKKYIMYAIYIIIGLIILSFLWPIITSFLQH